MRLTFDIRSPWVGHTNGRIVGDGVSVELTELGTVPLDLQAWIDETMIRDLSIRARVLAIREEHALTADGWPYEIITTSVRTAGHVPEIRIGAFYVMFQQGASALARIRRAGAVGEAKELFASARLELPRDVRVSVSAFWSPSRVRR